MNLNTYLNLTEAMLELQKRKFNRTFTLMKTGLICLQTKAVYQSSEICIVEYHRFGGQEEPFNKRIIFAIESNEKERGYIISSEMKKEYYRLLEFMDKVRISSSKLSNDVN